MSPSYKEHVSGYASLNLGISGEYTPNLLWRIEHGTLDGLSPKAVVVMFGVNNLGGGFTAQQTANGASASLCRLIGTEDDLVGFAFVAVEVPCLARKVQRRSGPCRCLGRERSTGSDVKAAYASRFEPESSDDRDVSFPTIAQHLPLSHKPARVAAFYRPVPPVRTRSAGLDPHEYRRKSTFRPSTVHWAQEQQELHRGCWQATATGFQQ
jgi:hypothetical protein